jgi:hypothetical protein
MKEESMAKEKAFRDASDESPAPFRMGGPSPYDEPDDFTVYVGPHGYVHVSPMEAVCQCGWHPRNHPGCTVLDHLKDFNAMPLAGNV